MDICYLIDTRTRLMTGIRLAVEAKVITEVKVRVIRLLVNFSLKFDEVYKTPT